MTFSEKGKRYFFVKLALFLGIMFIMLTGCDFGVPNTSLPRTNVAAQTKQENTNILNRKNEEEQKSPYIYTSIGKRDPFKSYFDSFKEKQKKNRQLGPLEKFDLDQLKLVGIISGISSPRALIEDPKGKGYIVRQGTRIGKNRGKIKQIKNNQVTVVEEYRDFSGKKISNPIKIILKREERIKND